MAADQLSSTRMTCMKHTLLTLGAALLLGQSPAAEAKPSRPNILLIVSDDNGPEPGCYGDPCARTPNLEYRRQALT